MSSSDGNTVINWNSVDEDIWENTYDVRIYSNETGSGDYYKIARRVNGTTYTTSLPEGNYSVTITAIDKIDSNIYSDVIVVPFTVSSGGAVDPDPGQSGEAMELAGSNRNETAAIIAREAYPDGAP